MEARDRLANLGLLGAAGIVWVLVGLVVTTRDPTADPMARYVGSLLIGLAFGLSTVPLFWLVVFGRHRRIAYQGDWTRAARRGAWVGMLAGVLVLLRVERVLEWPIALFLVALVFVAETTLSVER
ncbi:MAG TPA: hypothetical protein VFK54_13525 [Candidatus Limnocylindrales bacterium]|nr:hypothetical protein [Candidatus Limnocylindrales bacterium]